ncbi:MAG: hypothetical protein ACK56F_09875, partial [bacterium]
SKTRLSDPASRGCPTPQGMAPDETTIEIGRTTLSRFRSGPRRHRAKDAQDDATRSTGCAPCVA